VRWFEQAFEWEHMRYLFYPYYWGRRSTWVDKLNLKNDDPLFLQFLQAGYARVLVPVRNGFEHAVNFYLHTGKPWMGQGLPTIGDKTQNPLYLDIAEEIKIQSGALGNDETETPVGAPWEVRLPTILIKLEKEDPQAKKDDTLPEWNRDPYSSDEPTGTWTWRDGPPKA